MKSNFFKTSYLLLCAMLMLNTSISLGQQNKKKTTLGLLTFEALNKEQNYMEAALLTNTVKELFVESKKYIPLDRSQYSETAKFDELEAQKNIAFINGVVAKQGKQKGAIVLVGGQLTAVEYIQLNKGLQCKFNFTVNISDVESGELLATKVFKPGIGDKIPTAHGIDELTASTIKMTLLKNEIQNFIIANTPFFAKIIKLEKIGKNTNILLEVGEDLGIKKGDRFEIYKAEKIGKKDRLIPILKFGIAQVQGSDFSIGKIPRNRSEELQGLVNNPEVRLVCKQIECKICL